MARPTCRSFWGEIYSGATVAIVLSQQEEKRLLTALSRTFLDGYPNPERRGCPGIGVLKAIAGRRLTLEEAEPWIDHLSSCSPCTREFADLRHELRRHRAFQIGFVAAAIIIVVAVGAWLLLRQRTGPPQLQAAMLDLTDRGALRGPEETSPAPPLSLHRGLLDLTLYLPVGSQPGAYEVQVIREPGQPMWSAQGVVKLENGKATLHIRADLSNLPHGLYLLAVKPTRWSWNYYPLVLK